MLPAQHDSHVVSSSSARAPEDCAACLIQHYDAIPCQAPGSDSLHAMERVSMPDTQNLIYQQKVQLVKRKVQKKYVAV